MFLRVTDGSCEWEVEKGVPRLERGGVRSCNLLISHVCSSPSPLVGFPCMTNLSLPQSQGRQGTLATSAVSSSGWFGEERGQESREISLSGDGAVMKVRFVALSPSSHSPHYTVKG